MNNIRFKKVLVVALALILLLSTPLFVRPHHTASAQSGTNGKIVFQSLRDGNYEIYVMNADGSSQTRLTNYELEDNDPAWSPDGTKIAFSRHLLGGNNYEIYVMDADGSNQTRLTDNPAVDAHPAWSPDGSQFAFTSNRGGVWEVYVMNADGSNQTRLTNNTAYDAVPVWSPDGTRLAFESTRDGNYEIYVMNVDGSNQTNLTHNAFDDNSPHWSPNGTQIVFASSRDGNAEIYVMNADGSNPMNITHNPGSDYYPDWSPNGTQIVFNSSRDGNAEIYLINADGTNQTRLTNNTTDEQFPHWYGNVGGCMTSTPTTTYQGDTFALSLGCTAISGSVFGFQAGHTVTAGASLVNAQAATYTAGTIFQGQPILAGPNTLPLYALSLQAGGTQATGNFTLATVNYTAVAPGQTTFDLTNLILGDINGNALPNVAAPTTSATITINDLVLSLTGTVDPEGYADMLTFALDGNPTYSGLTPTYNAANGTTAFTYTNIKGHPASLLVDGPSHVACQETLTFPVDAGNEALPRTLILRSGDVNGDNHIDIVDAAAIGQGYGQAPTGELDINHDGAVNILDLIHVGRNYGINGPTECAPTTCQAVFSGGETLTYSLPVSELDYSIDTETLNPLHRQIQLATRPESCASGWAGEACGVHAGCGIGCLVGGTCLQYLP